MAVLGKNVLFDMDGVLVDYEPAFRRAKPRRRRARGRSNSLSPWPEARASLSLPSSDARGDCRVLDRQGAVGA